MSSTVGGIAKGTDGLLCADVRDLPPKALLLEVVDWVLQDIAELLAFSRVQQHTTTALQEKST